MNDKIKKGSLVRHLYLKDSPDLYVVKINGHRILCRYFSDGKFHLEEFEYDEILSEEVVEELKEERQLGNQAGPVQTASILWNFP